MRATELATRCGLLLLLALSGYGACGAGSAEARRSQFIDAVRAELPKALAASDATGAAVALVDTAAAKGVWVAGFGFTDGSEQWPVGPRTRFAIQSMTKSFTGTAALRAVDAGHVDLDQPITTVLPEFRVRSRFEVAPESRITLRHLLSHRAGLPHMVDRGNVYSADSPPFGEHIASISDAWLRFPVAARYAYSNAGYDLAGHVLAVAAGKAFEAYVHDEVLGPLGMHETGFDLASSGAGRPAVGHLPGVEAVPTDIPLLASGAMWSTAADMARFVSMQVAQGAGPEGPLLSAAGWRALHEIQFPVSTFQRSGYGLGVVAVRQPGGPLLGGWHNGGGYGFRSHMAWIPDLGLGYVVLQNGSFEEPLTAVGDAFDALAAEAEKASGVGPREPGYAAVACLPPDPPAARRWYGTYVGRSRVVTISHRAGEFGIWHREFTPLCFTSDDTVVDPEAGLADAYRFERGPDGRPQRLVGLNTGTTYEYNDGPGDPPGPDLDAWGPLLGSYQMTMYGEPAGTLLLRKLRGQLYLDANRIVAEGEPGLFFTAAGLTLDLRAGHMRYGGAPLTRVLPASPESAARATLRARELAELLAAGDFEGFMEAGTPEVQALGAHAVAAGWQHLVTTWGEHLSFGRADVRLIGEWTQVDLSIRFEGVGWTLTLTFDSDGRVAGVLFHAPLTWWLADPEAMAREARRLEAQGR